MDGIMRDEKETKEENQRLVFSKRFEKYQVLLDNRSGHKSPGEKGRENEHRIKNQKPTEMTLNNQQKIDLMVSGFVEIEGEKYRKVTYGYVKAELLPENQICATNGNQSVILEKVGESNY